MYKYVIVAKSQEQARFFCIQNSLKLKEVLYASRPDVLLGICNLTVIFLNGWWEQKDHTAIYDAIMQVKEGHEIKILRMNTDEFLTKEMAGGI